MNKHIFISDHRRIPDPFRKQDVNSNNNTNGDESFYNGDESFECSGVDIPKPGKRRLDTAWVWDVFVRWGVLLCFFLFSGERPAFKPGKTHHTRDAHSIQMVKVLALEDTGHSQDIDVGPFSFLPSFLLSLSRYQPLLLITTLRTHD